MVLSGMFSFLSLTAVRFRLHNDVDAESIFLSPEFSPYSKRLRCFLAKDDALCSTLLSPIIKSTPCEMNGEWRTGETWKEAVLVWFEVLLPHVVGGTQHDHEVLGLCWEPKTGTSTIWVFSASGAAICSVRWCHVSRKYFRAKVKLCLVTCSCS